MSEPARKQACEDRYTRLKQRAENRQAVCFLRRSCGGLGAHLQAAHVAVHRTLHQQRVAFVVSGVGAHTCHKRLRQLLVVPEPARETTSKMDISTGRT
jgi:hypothetical protein